MKKSHKLPTLEELGSKYGTDKASHSHNYLDFYDRYFSSLRHEPIRLLEIGVFHGKSIQMFSEYFTEGKILGIDINPNALQFNGERVVVELADQSNLKDITELSIKHGPFDIVIDDGSHYWDHQLTSLKHFYPFVKAGGYYVIEDIHTSYGRAAEGHKRGASISTADYLHKFLDYLMAGSELDVSGESDPFLRTYVPDTEFISCFQSTALLKKKDLQTNPKRSHANPPSLFSEDIDFVEPFNARLVAHIGGFGDLTSTKYLVAGLRGISDWVQGFSLEVPSELAGDLEYRAYLNDLTWTDWVRSGAYVGTRGQAKAIKGFAVRLSAKLASKYEVTCLGCFERHSDLVLSGNGQDCIGNSGAELQAMQIVIQKK